MKILKEILAVIMIIILITITMLIGTKNNIYTNAQVVPEKIVKVGVILYSFDDTYISLVRQNLEQLQKENEGKVKFTFYDGKRDQNTQNEIINLAIESDYDLLLTNLVDLNTGTVESVINKAKQKNIPIILFNVVPFITDAIKSYNKALVVATDAAQSGNLQGKLIIDEWNKNKNLVDKNGDNILQYVMLTGQRDNTMSAERTRSSISAINDTGIKTQELALKICDWDRNCAKTTVESLLLTYGNKIEAIIANNDSMAIGAIESLQKAGYNKGDKSKTIPVVGIDAIPEAQELISKGFMTGTVVQDPSLMAEILYKVGMNIASNKPPLEGTDYKFDETGFIIRMPYSEYIK